MMTCFLMLYGTRIPPRLRSQQCVASPVALMGPDLRQQTDVEFIGHLLLQHLSFAAITTPEYNTLVVEVTPSPDAVEHLPTPCNKSTMERLCTVH